MDSHENEIQLLSKYIIGLKYRLDNNKTNETVELV